MNLSQLGLSAMNSAQARLMTAGHNINNAGTEGYSRQNVITSTAGASQSGQGFFGRGVQVDTVRRAYDSFLSNQFVSAQSKGAMLASYGNQVKQVNNLLADNTVGISPAIQKFFDGIQAVASTPGDPAARQELLGRTESMVTQFNQMNRFLNDQRNDINGQVGTMVNQANSYVSQIAELNKQITSAQSNGGHAPNDLLDQRDQAVTELNTIVKVNVLDQNGQFGLSIGNGQLLLSGTTTYKLSAEPSLYDPRDIAVFTSVPSGKNGQVTKVPLDETSIKGGSLAGLMKYRSESLDGVQRQLGQLATGMALSMNAAHAKGVDMNGDPGTALFKIGQPEVVGRTGNAGAGVIDAKFNVDGAGDIRANDYSIKYDGANYTVTRLPDNTQVFFAPTMENAQIDGMTVTMGGEPIAGDAWTLMPTRNAAEKLETVIMSADKFAAASTGGGSANGDNALEMAKLQTSKSLGGGTMSFNEAYSQIVNKVAVHAQQNGGESAAQRTLIEQTFAAQQSVSGVNLNEEYVNLDRFQEQFAAASKLIEVSASLFDTLLSIKA